MIRIQNIPLPLDGDLEQLRKKAARILGVRPGALEELTLVHQSIDARKKQDVHYVYTVDVSLRTGEEQAVERTGKKNVSLVLPKPYLFPEVKRRSPSMPVVVGMGPAGLFAALFLARNGLPCVVLERGQDVDRRTAQVERFWDSGLLDPSSNVQFGEGGAGTFSDGKLNTGIKSPHIRHVLDRHPRPPHFRRHRRPGGVGGSGGCEVVPQAPHRHRYSAAGGQAHPAGADLPGVRRALRPLPERAGDRLRRALRRVGRL